MELATQSLGRPYSLTGIVIHGDERGRKIGFPTANLSVWEEKILPPAGVYATLALIEKQVFYSVTNVGFRRHLRTISLNRRLRLICIISIEAFMIYQYNYSLSKEFVRK